MYELIQVAERTCYIQSPAKIGLVRLDDSRVCLIDSGSDKDAGRKVRESGEKIVTLCARPRCFEQQLLQLFADYGLTMDFQQYALVGSTVRSYLSRLKNGGRVNARFADGMLLWEQA